MAIAMATRSRIWVGRWRALAALASLALLLGLPEAALHAAGPSGTPASAQASGAAFEQRLLALEGELRCLVCQNQTLADSSAGLAQDLRREVRGLAESGKSDAEIKTYLVARYGDFVLYKPPFKPSTWLLWLGPLLLLGVMAWALFGQRKPPQSARPDPAQPAQPDPHEPQI